MTDYVANAYKVVRDNTVNNDNLTNAEALGVLELVAHEICQDMLYEVHKEAMNKE